MMTYAPQPSASYDYMPVRRSNVLGIIGFVCALVGLFSGGHILSPLGLILSLIALGDRPRAFAVWGAILGLLGTCGWLLVLLVLVIAAVGLTAAGVGVFFFSQADRIELTSDMGKIAMLAEDYKHANRGVAPADLSVLALQIANTIDPWGHAYRYELIEEDPGFDIVSDGPDGASGTEDDVRLSRLDKYWEDAGKDFQRQMAEFEKRSQNSHTTTIKIAPNAGMTVGEGGVTINAGQSSSSQPSTRPSTDNDND